MPATAEDDTPKAAEQAALDLIRKTMAEQAKKLADPDEDENPDDGIRLLKNGWVRFTIGDKRYRLRRPFLGELRTLDVAYEAAIDEIQALSDALQDEGAGYKAEAEKLQARKNVSDKERNRKLREIRRKDQAAAKKFRADEAEVRVRWWQQVFETVGVDGVPEDWPANIVDRTLPARVISHWQSTP